MVCRRKIEESEGLSCSWLKNQRDVGLILLAKSSWQLRLLQYYGVLRIIYHDIVRTHSSNFSVNQIIWCRKIDVSIVGIVESGCLTLETEVHLGCSRTYIYFLELSSLCLRALETCPYLIEFKAIRDDEEFVSLHS